MSYDGVKTIIQRSFLHIWCSCQATCSCLAFISSIVPEPKRTPEKLKLFSVIPFQTKVSQKTKASTCVRLCTIVHITIATYSLTPAAIPMSTPMVTMMMEVTSTVPSIMSDCAVRLGGDYFIPYTPICKNNN